MDLTYPTIIDKFQSISPVCCVENSSRDDNLHQYWDSNIPGPVTELNEKFNRDCECNNVVQSGDAWAQNKESSLAINRSSAWEPIHSNLNPSHQIVYQNPWLHQPNSAHQVASSNFQENSFPRNIPQHHQSPPYPLQFPQTLEPSTLLNEFNVFKALLSQFLDQIDMKELFMKKTKKTAFKQSQVDKLEKQFRDSRRLTKLKMEELAEELNLTPKQIRVWFQNRRMKEKRLKLNVKIKV